MSEENKGMTFLSQSTIIFYFLAGARWVRFANIGVILTHLSK